MRFYDREKEIAKLKRLDDLAERSAQLTVLTGRRRTGKTTLMMHALEGCPQLYDRMKKDRIITKHYRYKIIEYKRHKSMLFIVYIR